MDSKPTPYARKTDDLPPVESPEWTLDATSPFEVVIMRLVLMHRSTLDSHERRFEAAIEHLKGVR